MYFTITPEISIRQDFLLASKLMPSFQGIAEFGLSINFKNWIWIVDHTFVMDLDWIDNPKKSD